MAGSTWTSHPHSHQGRGWFFPRARSTKIYSKVEVFIWCLAGLLTVSGGTLCDSSVLTKTQGGCWERRKDGLPTGQVGLLEEELRAEGLAPPRATTSLAGPLATGPPGLLLAGWAPRRLAPPQPGRHLGDWPPRAAISQAGTSGTGPPAGQHLGDWPPRAAIGRAGISGCRWPFLLWWEEDRSSRGWHPRALALALSQGRPPGRRGWVQG